MYRAKRTDTHAGKVQLLRARDNLEADLDALREAGLLGPWRKTKAYGRGFDVLPMPPADYAEACKRAAQAVRKTGDGLALKDPKPGSLQGVGRKPPTRLGSSNTADPETPEGGVAQKK
jgi:hypothetical protein